MIGFLLCEPKGVSWKITHFTELIAIGVLLVWMNSLFLFVFLNFRTVPACHRTYIVFHHLEYAASHVWALIIFQWKARCLQAWFNKQNTRCTSCWYDSRSRLENNLSAFSCMTLLSLLVRVRKKTFPYPWQLRELTRPINTSTLLASFLGSSWILPAVLRFHKSRVFLLLLVRAGGSSANTQPLCLHSPAYLPARN